MRSLDIHLVGEFSLEKARFRFVPFVFGAAGMTRTGGVDIEQQLKF